MTDYQMNFLVEKQRHDEKCGQERRRKYHLWCPDCGGKTIYSYTPEWDCGYFLCEECAYCLSFEAEYLAPKEQQRFDAYQEMKKKGEN